MTSSFGTFTYWSLLGLSPGSDSDQLKEAFRREARRWHPDLNANDLNAEERFKWVNEAYLVLSDPRKRFEWEVAGRPPIRIKEIKPQVKVKIADQTQIKSTISKNDFNSAEKMLLILISSVCLLLLNLFLF